MTVSKVSGDSISSIGAILESKGDNSLNKLSSELRQQEHLSQLKEQAGTNMSIRQYIDRFIVGDKFQPKDALALKRSYEKQEKASKSAREASQKAAQKRAVKEAQKAKRKIAERLNISSDEQKKLLEQYRKNAGTNGTLQEVIDRRLGIGQPNRQYRKLRAYMAQQAAGSKKINVTGEIVNAATPVVQSTADTVKAEASTVVQAATDAARTETKHAARAVENTAKKGFIKAHPKISAGIAAALAVVGGLAYVFSEKDNKEIKNLQQVA